MPEPDVVRVMREFKVGLLQRDARQMQEMSQRWLGVEKRLRLRMETLAEDVARRRAAGEVLTEEQLRRLDRYRQLMAQVRAEVGEYERWADGYVTRSQREMAGLGLDHAADAIRIGGIKTGFNRLPVHVVERMAGLTVDGSPLFDVLKARALWPEAVDGLTQVLTDAIT
ncbi:MAG TPA: hypothetical protein VM537_03550, partial [Anaerolineae bacterium]|nr:hypothetical protein [Anaerolineae bacterium]